MKQGQVQESFPVKFYFILQRSKIDGYLTTLLWIEYRWALKILD